MLLKLKERSKSRDFGKGELPLKSGWVRFACSELFPETQGWGFLTVSAVQEHRLVFNTINFYN